MEMLCEIELPTVGGGIIDFTYDTRRELGEISGTLTGNPHLRCDQQTVLYELLSMKGNRDPSSFWLPHNTLPGSASRMSSKLSRSTTGVKDVRLVG